MKNILKITFVIIGTIIGAGFASGQEINLFFSSYGGIGIIGMVISCILTGLTIYYVFEIINKKQLKNYKEFLLSINPNKKLNYIIQMLIRIFLLISFYIMIAGFCAYFKQEFNTSTYISAICMAALCYITFSNDTKGIVSINTVLVPFLTIFIIFLGIKNLPYSTEYLKNIEITNQYNFRWLISSVLYTSYNNIILIPILVELSSYSKTKLTNKRSSLLCSVILGFVGICICCLLFRGQNYIAQTELPMVEIVKKFGNVYPWIYGAVIIVAIFTSAISAGYGFLKNVSSSEKTYKKANLLICVSSILVAPLGFSNLVNILYPIFGVLGLIQMFYIFKKYRDLKNNYITIEKNRKN